MADSSRPGDTSGPESSGSGGMGRMLGSWLSGPEAAADRRPTTDKYRGQSLGLPESGPGALARSGKRVWAIFLDWFGCSIICGMAVGFMSSTFSTLVLGVWFAVGVFCVTLFGFTPGQFAAGLRVARVDGAAHVGIVRAFARQILIVFMIPPLINDLDGRGLHDRATQTALVLTR
jgi:uncharacterized RDD family membrane protein YckC